MEYIWYIWLYWILVEITLHLDCIVIKSSSQMSVDMSDSVCELFNIFSGDLEMLRFPCILEKLFQLFEGYCSKE